MIILGVGLHELPLRLGLLALRLIERRLERPRINLKQHLPLLDKGPFCIALLEQVARHLRLDHRIDMPSRVPIHSLESGTSCCVTCATSTSGGDTACAISWTFE